MEFFSGDYPAERPTEPWLPAAGSESRGSTPAPPGNDPPTSVTLQKEPAPQADETVEPVSLLNPDSEKQSDTDSEVVTEENPSDAPAVDDASPPADDEKGDSSSKQEEGSAVLAAADSPVAQLAAHWSTLSQRCQVGKS